MKVITEQEVPNDSIETRDPAVSTRNWAVQLTYLVLSVINGLLVIRFILTAFGANRENAFADFIYGVTSGLVSPFYGLFNTQAEYGVGRIEFETITAIVVYSLIALLIAKILTLGTRDANR